MVGLSLVNVITPYNNNFKGTPVAEEFLLSRYIVTAFPKWICFYAGAHTILKIIFFGNIFKRKSFYHIGLLNATKNIYTQQTYHFNNISEIASDCYDKTFPENVLQMLFKKC